MTDVPKVFYAFPWYSEAHQQMCPGMELCDYFAAKAMPAVVRQCAGDTKGRFDSMEQLFAYKAYDIAAAMLAERERRNE